MCIDNYFLFQVVDTIARTDLGTDSEPLHYNTAVATTAYPSYSQLKNCQFSLYKTVQYRVKENWQCFSCE